MIIEYFSEQEAPVVMHGRTELKLPEPDYLDTLQDGESVMCSDNAGCMSWCLRLFNKETRGATNAVTGKVVKWDNIVAVRDFDFVNLCKREL